MRDVTTEAATPSQRSELRLRRAWLSPGASLVGRILVINLIGLVLTTAGVLFFSQYRQGLIELRARALVTQGEVIAIALAESNASLAPDGVFDADIAMAGLRQLSAPLTVRARLFDREGRKVGDTDETPAAPEVTVAALPPPDAGPLELAGRAWSALDHAFDRLLEMSVTPPPLYVEEPIMRGDENGDAYSTQPEVYQALRGETVTGVHVDEQGELIVAVWLPIQRFKLVQSALVLTTEGGDIAALVREERAAFLRVVLVALCVSVVLSVLLASGIARPLRRLAHLAERSGAMHRRAAAPGRVAFPPASGRADEIGYLSQALREMTEALYNRVEGVERFAADVAHEIKNPLTSLRSAVESLRRTDDPHARERLLRVIVGDVRRLDRLVTDISNASRLDAELAREDAGELDLGALLRTVSDVAGDPRLHVSAPAQGPRCRGIDSRLGQVFVNLVDNALSFSPPEGRVDVTCRRAGPGRLRVVVEDDGPGVPQERREAIFDRFHSDRPDTGESSDHSGLGLAIARQIVEAHGGRIWVEGRDGRPGARFVVDLPA